MSEFYTINDNGWGINVDTPTKFYSEQVPNSGRDEIAQPIHDMVMLTSYVEMMCAINRWRAEKKTSSDRWCRWMFATPNHTAILFELINYFLTNTNYDKPLSVQTIAYDLELSRQTVNEVIKSGKEQGFIDDKNRPTPHGLSSFSEGVKLVVARSHTRLFASSITRGSINDWVKKQPEKTASE
tara:strand:- start:237 stop:785 length:549 start_codon:yes stop_codon:yes gene_type:complete